MSERTAMRDAERRINIAKREGAVELDLSGIELWDLPYTILQLTELQSLNLSNNRLTKLLNSLYRLTQLQSLDLHNNRLTSCTVSDDFAIALGQRRQPLPHARALESFAPHLRPDKDWFSLRPIGSRVRTDVAFYTEGQVCTSDTLLEKTRWRHHDRSETSGQPLKELVSRPAGGSPDAPRPPPD